MYKIICKNARAVLVSLSVMLLVLCGGLYAEASTLYFAPPSEDIYQGDIFPVEIRLDSTDESINVLQADINFPPGTLEVASFRRTNSIVRFWLQEPSFSNMLGLASLVGGLPAPGFQEEKGLVGVIHFKAVKSGNAKIGFYPTSRALINDGLGNDAPLTLLGAKLVISDFREEYQSKTPVPLLDTISPLAFTPTIGQTESAFDGKYFVTFETQDLESGPSHYEVREFRNDQWGEWKVAVSPYVLDNQEGTVRVFVKAVDNAGNETIGVSEVTMSKKKLSIYVTILLIALLIFAIVRKKIVKCV